MFVFFVWFFKLRENFKKCKKKKMKEAKVEERGGVE